MRTKLLTALLAILVLAGPLSTIRGTVYGKFDTTQTTQKVVEASQSIFSASFLMKLFSVDKSLPYLVILAFFFGILVSFTPCIYPMIPLTVSIISPQATASLMHNFSLSVAYVLGTAVIYSTLGYLAATTTMIFGQWFANPLFILFVIVLCLYLAFSMFGFYDIYIPRLLQNRQSVEKKGSLLYSFVAGLVAGSIASPCLTPALAVLLVLVAKLANPVAGLFILFAFALGMGCLLMLIGTFSGISALLPKAGIWMLEVKRIFGFIMLGTCVYFISPIIPIYLIYSLIALIFLCASIYYFIRARGTQKIPTLKATSQTSSMETHENEELIEQVPPSSLDKRVKYATAIVCLIVGLMLLFYVV